MPYARELATAVLGLRVAYGVALVVAPERLTRRWLGPVAERHGARVAVRALGAREAILHSAAIVAARRNAPLRPWLAASVAGDVCDMAVTTAERGGLPSGAAPATAGVAGAAALVSAGVAWAVSA
jgi:hypothetical protein